MSKPKVLVVDVQPSLALALHKEFSGEGFEVAVYDFKTKFEAQSPSPLIHHIVEGEFKSVLNEFVPQVIIFSGLHEASFSSQEEERKATDFYLTREKLVIETAQEVLQHFWFLFLSTDHVFDGLSPPFKTNSQLKPSTAFGRIKASMESLLLSLHHESGILRTPDLFGLHLVSDSDSDSEHDSSAPPPAIHKVVHRKLRKSKDQGLLHRLLLAVVSRDNEVVLDDWQQIRPTFVGDVAQVCRRLVEQYASHTTLHGTWHFSGSETTTRYKLAEEIGKALELSPNHLVSSPTPATATQREVTEVPPHNVELECSAVRLMHPIQITPLQQMLDYVLKHLTA